MAFKDYLTAEGERLLAKAVSKSMSITFTKLVMGSGYLAEGTSEKNISDVIIPVQEIPIKSVQLNGSTSAVISAYINNESLTAGFYFREKAIYMQAGTEEVLAIYGNAGSTAEYIDTADVCITEKLVRTVLQLSSNEIANLTITDGTSALAPIVRNDMTLDEFVQTDTALSVVAGQAIVLKGLVYYFLGGDQRDTANYTAGIKLSDEYETAIKGADEFGGIAATQNALNKVYSIIQEVKTAFQDGCDVIVAGCTTYGSTPDSNSPNDIVDSIRDIYENRYDAGHDAGYDEGFNDGGAAAEPTLQAKSVTLGTTEQVVKPDADYDGLSQVTVPAVKLQEKSATLNISTKSVSLTPDSGYNGLSKATVSITTQEKTASITSGSKAITPDSGKLLSKVTVNGPTNYAGTTMDAGSVTSDNTYTYFSPSKAGYVDETTKIRTPNSNLINNMSGEVVYTKKDNGAINYTYTATEPCIVSVFAGYTTTNGDGSISVTSTGNLISSGNSASSSAHWRCVSRIYKLATNGTLTINSYATGSGYANSEVSVCVFK